MFFLISEKMKSTAPTIILLALLCLAEFAVAKGNFYSMLFYYILFRLSSLHKHYFLLRIRFKKLLFEGNHLRV